MDNFQKITKNRKFLAATMLLYFCFLANNVMGQEGYIMQINGDNIYMNIPNVKVGDILSAVSGEGYITDPRTGKQIKKEPEAVGQIKVIKITDSYSIGKVFGHTVIDELSESMTVLKAVVQTDGYGETTVMIAPASVMLPEGINTLVSGSNGQTGYIGDVISAELVNELLKCQKITVIDRTVLATQEFEMNLIGSGMMDQNTAFELGKVSGARYVVQITVQKPDLEKVGNNAKLGTLLGGVSNVLGNKRALEKTATYAPDLASTNIKVKVKIFTKIVDLQTSRVLFQSSGEGTASGTPQIQLEFMQLGAGNIELNQNADFSHSVTGRAIEDAFKKIGKELRQYFDKNL